MIVSVPKPMDKIMESLSEAQRVFVVTCGGCPVGCKSGGEERAVELAKALSESDREVTGSTMIDFLCNKTLVGTRLGHHLAELKNTQAVLVISCGVGVQATAHMIDLPVVPANDTLFSQGMQGLWPSEERCAGCGDCVLHLTGGICPITTCTKSLLNGMCGGQRDGKCEVDSDRDCGWYLIYNRLKELGRLDNLRKLPPLRDFRKLEVPGNERGTTRWALEKPEIYEATDLASVE